MDLHLVRKKRWRNRQRVHSNQRYKLYRTGEFYDIANDVLEKTPLDVDTLTPSARSTHEMLGEALSKYTDSRPAKFANWKEIKPAKQKKKKAPEHKGRMRAV